MTALFKCIHIINHRRENEENRKNRLIKLRLLLKLMQQMNKRGITREIVKTRRGFTVLNYDNETIC